MPEILDKPSSAQKNYQEFSRSLKRIGFRGEVHLDQASRTALSTDNSVYELYPQAVVYPKNHEDLELLMSQLSKEEFREICIGPRGGGTGTNGQSLTDGIVVDTSRHMNNILEINPEEGWAYVECGVVKDQLNAELERYGLFFAPELSTSNRATIGGMISTDASGQGSVVYGKTRDHVLELETVVHGGDTLRSKSLDESEEQQKINSPSRALETRAYQELARIHRERAEEIEAIFPKLNRCLTGYDLAHIRDNNGRLNLNNILCGSEGSLGLLSRAKIRVLPIPKFYSLFVVYYEDFMSSLRDANELMSLNPASIETIDSKVLGLAMNDFVWQSVKPLLPDADPSSVKGMNFLEITSDTLVDHEHEIARISAALSAENSNGRIRYSLVSGRSEVDKIWAMRKRAVGLLGNASGEARPVAFVEDTAVPPEKLADFIAEFRGILDKHNLEYGMFGHVDAGVLHVRPALDFKDEAQVRLAWQISDEVADLTQAYDGLLWGEHGKGIRSSYSPAFFGELYRELQAIKHVFDPYNQINPGKIATPLGAQPTVKLIAVNEAPIRGGYDRLIADEAWAQYQDAVHCNGNGACHNWNPDDAMCPSWKGTRDRRYTPKARAMLVKQWLRNNASTKSFLASEPSGSWLKEASSYPTRWWRTRKANKADSNIAQRFDLEVYDSMATCLACKSCTGQCPIKVDVPEFRARFLSIFHTRYARPIKDYLVASLEKVIPLAAKFPGPYNLAVKSELGAWFIAKTTGFVDGPAIDKAYKNNDQIPAATIEVFDKMLPEQRAKSVIIVEDAFYRYFSPTVVRDLADLISSLGLKPYRLPYVENGKPLHVHGFLEQFSRTAKQTASTLKQFNNLGVTLCGVDPSMTLTFRNEYAKHLEDDEVPAVRLIQECIAEKLRQGYASVPALPKQQFVLDKKVVLYPHCNEQTIANASLKDWEYIFAALDLPFVIKKTGCCGMSGTFGHEQRNRKLSAKIFDLSWRTNLARSSVDEISTATGYSCRSQTAREADTSLAHPVTILSQYLRGAGSGQHRHIDNVT